MDNSSCLQDLEILLLKNVMKYKSIDFDLLTPIINKQIELLDFSLTKTTTPEDNYDLFFGLTKIDANKQTSTKINDDKVELISKTINDLIHKKLDDLTYRIEVQNSKLKELKLNSNKLLLDQNQIKTNKTVMVLGETFKEDLDLKFKKLTKIKKSTLVEDILSIKETIPINEMLAELKNNSVFNQILRNNLYSLNIVEFVDEEENNASIKNIYLTLIKLKIYYQSIVLGLKNTKQECLLYQGLDKLNTIQSFFNKMKHLINY